MELVYENLLVKKMVYTPVVSLLCSTRYKSRDKYILQLQGRRKNTNTNTCQNNKRKYTGTSGNTYLEKVMEEGLSLLYFIQCKNDKGRVQMKFRKKVIWGTVDSGNWINNKRLEMTVRLAGKV